MNFKEKLSLAQRGDKKLLEEIIEIYRPLLLKYSMVNYRLDEDLNQELVVELLKCIRNFEIREEG